MATALIVKNRSSFPLLTALAVLKRIQSDSQELELINIVDLWAYLLVLQNRGLDLGLSESYHPEDFLEEIAHFEQRYLENTSLQLIANWQDKADKFLATQLACLSVVTEHTEQDPRLTNLMQQAIDQLK